MVNYYYSAMNYKNGQENIVKYNLYESLYSAVINELVLRYL